MNSTIATTDLDGLDHPATGFRLHRLEVLNWGTFDQRVWRLDMAGRDGLLTGDIGSGKSTLVDAVTTLLLPAHRIAYNKAAGAQNRERDLRSYVLGHFKSERNETTGSSRPVGLRGAGTYSVILGHFRNSGFNSDVTLAQVFWMKEGVTGQPERFYVTADAELSISEHFGGFGSELTGLRRQLRKSGAAVIDHFPEYSRDFRRKLAIASDQAMDLFHQTVSMKSVGDLNDFVREHMLESFDAAAWVGRLVGHFEDLTRAHDAVVKARSQLADLKPLVQDCDAHDQLQAKATELRGQRNALRYFFAGLRHRLHTARSDLLAADIAKANEQLSTVEESLTSLRRDLTHLKVQQAGHGGNEIADIERRIADRSVDRDQRQERRKRYDGYVAAAKLAPVATAAHFDVRTAEIRHSATKLDAELADLDNAILETRVGKTKLSDEAAGIASELASLRQRKSNIPDRNMKIRQRLCAELNLDPVDLPFVGELIHVAPEHRDWEGAAERVLRGFGLSLLVSQDLYRQVSEWVNVNHLGGKLVYYRVPSTLSRQGIYAATEGSLAYKIEIKDGPFYDWLDRELVTRAAHVCVDTMDEFRRHDVALTRTGQIRAKGRHEKDDSYRVDDRRNYVLGWSNEQKIDALLANAQQIQAALHDVDAELNRLVADRAIAVPRKSLLDKLSEVATRFADIDWESAVFEIDRLQRHKRELESASGELARISAEIDRTDTAIALCEKAKADLSRRIGGLIGALENADKGAEEAARTIAEPGAETAARYSDALSRRIPLAPDSAESCNTEEHRLFVQLTDETDATNAKATTVTGRIINKMKDFRQKYPTDSIDMDANVAAADEYRALQARLLEDDLPRFEAAFKEYLNTNTIRDIAGFHSELNKQVELISSRIATINTSLVGIDYNEGRYIRLESSPTPNQEIRAFRDELRQCSHGSIGADNGDQYAEDRFLLVKNLIEKFRGREGHADSDRNWVRRVTDVRNWCTFAASERWRADDTEHENYTDSGGKSGGQKEKLAYTILAASLAYQFNLKWDVRRSKDFRFVVIDEAFGRGSDESTRFALALFRKLGLQLLIVTPLQKIHVIEPFVASVGYVENKHGDCSQLQCLTIEEYRRRKRLHSMVTVDGRNPDAAVS
jgi:uncharacterized protein YPO0396